MSKKFICIPYIKRSFTTTLQNICTISKLAVHNNCKGTTSKKSFDPVKICPKQEYKLRKNLPSIDKENKENAKHNVSNVAVHVVERSQKRQLIGTQKVVVAYVFISSVV